MESNQLEYLIQAFGGFKIGILDIKCIFNVIIRSYTDGREAS